MNTTTDLVIGATVNETSGTVTITANGLDVATISLRNEWQSVIVHTVGIEYRAPRTGFYTATVSGRPSFSSEPTTHEVPESVVRTLAAQLGVRISE